MLFSLIVATIGRKEDVLRLLESLTQQNIDHDIFEVIVIDQNEENILQSIIDEYKIKLKHLHHIRSNVKGLSYNRNIGINIAQGEILAFPDDDCLYYPDTLKSVLKAFDNSTYASFILGSIYDRDEKRNIIRRWPIRQKKVNIKNFFFLYSSITIFTKNKIHFSTDLGVGARFGSYEDADYIIRHIKLYGSGLYTPSINVWHPEAGLNVMSLQKVYSYGEGFGALCRMHKSFTINIIFLSSIAFHSLQFLYAAIRFDGLNMEKRYISLKSRILGWWQYGGHNRNN